MIKTMAAAAVAMLIAAPVFAQEVPANAGLSEVTPLGTVAPGQPSYAYDRSGNLVNLQDVIDQQVATLPEGSAPRTGPYDDKAYGGPEKPEANGLNASTLISDPNSAE
jgi:hypothetical protein